MSRAEILQSPEYWLTGIQISLYTRAVSYRKEHKLTMQQLEQYLQIDHEQFLQLMRGDYQGTLEETVQLMLKLRAVPSWNGTSSLDELLQFVEHSSQNPTSQK